MNILDSSLASVLVVCFISEVIRTSPDGWVAGLIGNIATSAQLELELGLSLAKCQYLSLEAKNEKNKGTLFSGTSTPILISTEILIKCSSKIFI